MKRRHRESKIERKSIYLGVAFITFLLGIIIVSTWLVRTRFTAVSYDGRSGVATIDWKSADGVMVYEATYYFASEAEAQKHLEERLREAETIIERKKDPYIFSAVDERIVVAYVNQETKQKSFSIIELDDKTLHFVSAYSLEYALMFDKSWLKLG